MDGGKSIEANSTIEKMYKSIINQKSKFGTFHKCLFHLHTPASHDYELYSSYNDKGKTYNKLSDADMLEIALKEELMSAESFSTVNEIKFDNVIFSSCKEYLTYLLIAQKLCDNDIELVVISDHNTIDGYCKLCNAIKIYKRTKASLYFPEVLLGIEISCGDKNHIVGIFNKKEELDKIKAWISDNIMSQEDGTYLTSHDVLSWINQQGGLGYIAHIDTSNIFKEGYLSGTYKKKLFNSENCIVTGISDRNKANDIKKRISNYTKNDICFVIDSDSHAIDTIGEKFFWIKGQKCDFQMIKKSFRDYSIALELDKPQKPKSYIKGMSILSNDNNFLSKNPKETNKENIFSLQFSESLNCFIGARGTGKSTVINVLEYILGLQCRSKSTLKLICEHKDIMILYCHNDTDYIIVFSAPIKEKNDDNILKYFEESTPRNQGYRHQYNFNKKRIAEYSIDNYIKVFRLVETNPKITIENVNNREYLNKFFNMGYSVNELVQTASSDNINTFINNLLFMNKIVSTSPDVSSVRSIKRLSNLFSSIDELLENRLTQVHDIIDKYNANQEGKLKIVYGQNKYYLYGIKTENLFKATSNNAEQFYNKFNIRNQDLWEYIDSIICEIGFVEFLRKLLSDSFSDLNKIIPLVSRCVEITRESIEKEIVEIDATNLMTVFSNIKNDILRKDNLKVLKDHLQSFVSNVEYFELEFNVNNKEHSEKPGSKFKKVSNLSLGQKVVAMLSFILSYGEFINDSTPLIIDQPEDNLDNRYIYRNLVQDLKNLKSKRQIIIATHSATIVTNAKAEQVIVMESDERHGWVEKTGYPTESAIVKYIIDLLEGGPDSFNHKCFTYSDVLKSESN